MGQGAGQEGHQKGQRTQRHHLPGLAGKSSFKEPQAPEMRSKKMHLGEDKDHAGEQKFHL